MAARAGVRRPHAEPRRSNDQSSAGNDGGFIYMPGWNPPEYGEGTKSYGGMTAAGMISLLFAGVDETARASRRRTEWITTNYTLENNPGTDGKHGLFYFYNAFAKVMAAYGVVEFTDGKGQTHNWRNRLAQKLSLQAPDGSTRGPRTKVPTARDETREQRRGRLARLGTRPLQRDEHQRRRPRDDESKRHRPTEHPEPLASWQAQAIYRPMRRRSCRAGRARRGTDDHGCRNLQAWQGELATTLRTLAAPPAGELHADHRSRPSWKARPPTAPSCVRTRRFAGPAAAAPQARRTTLAPAAAPSAHTSPLPEQRHDHASSSAEPSFRRKVRRRLNAVCWRACPGSARPISPKRWRTRSASRSRIQCTPDLLPADITGSEALVENGALGPQLTFRRGPLFAPLVLVDEINRATSRTQSALLEAMQEGQVTCGGTGYRLPSPFWVLATQNPIELEGTYPLPEAQLDRFFFKCVVPYPSSDALLRIVDVSLDEAERCAGVGLQHLDDRDDVRATRCGTSTGGRPCAGSGQSSASPGRDLRRPASTSTPTRSMMVWMRRSWQRRPAGLILADPGVRRCRRSAIVPGSVAFASSMWSWASPGRGNRALRQRGRGLRAIRRVDRSMFQSRSRAAPPSMLAASTVSDSRLSEPGWDLAGAAPALRAVLHALETHDPWEQTRPAPAQSNSSMSKRGSLTSRSTCRCSRCTHRRRTTGTLAVKHFGGIERHIATQCCTWRSHGARRRRSLATPGRAT